MLVLSRKQDQKIVIDGNIEVTVVGIRGDKIRLGISAPKEVDIYRAEMKNNSSEEDKPTGEKS